MDSNGIPISFEAFVGNALDQTTLRPAMKRTVDHFDLARFILVSDRGMISGPNIMHVINAGHGYIMSKRIKKTAKGDRKWILEDNGYINLSEGFKFKSRIVTRTLTDENDKKHKVKQKVVVYWSKKYYYRECKEHRKFLEFVEAFKENPANFRVSKTQQGYLKKFMKKEFVNKMTGEVIHGSDLMGFIDEDKLSKNTEYYGYYQIISSELEMSAQEIIEKYHGLSQIENQFKIMKSTLETRPMYVNTPERIEAHLTVCLISLILMRVIQFMVKKHPMVKLEDSLTWNEGFSADRVQVALNKLQVEELAQGFYRFNNINDPDLVILLESFGLDTKRKLMTAGDLRKIASKLIHIA
ncbi:MAG: IS1634 family transposase [Defluviitaleaceae bacterium]|nr:IS1634 family transposase [Defluviitaleaceae bacterium]